MKWTLPLLILASFQASALVTCLPLAAVTQVQDDECGAISEGARACFAKLNSEFYRVNNTTRAELIADYEREIKKLQDEFIPALGRVGEDTRMCLNETGRVEVVIEEMQIDLADLKGIRRAKPKSR